MKKANDIVILGDTGLKVSRLGLGLGSSNGIEQLAQGAKSFNLFIKHAYECGITLYDTSQSYITLPYFKEAIKDIPREKIFIQSKINQPINVLETIDNHRKDFNTDYIDCMLIHGQIYHNWTDIWKKAMDDFDIAMEKKWIKAKGVSCHSLPALRSSVISDWPQIHLVRVNPYCINTDSEKEVFSYNTYINDNDDGYNIDDIEDVDITVAVNEIKKMKEKNRGVIGMKIFGAGRLNTDVKREDSLRFAMNIQEIDSVIIGFSNIEQINNGINLMNKVLSH